MTHELRAAAVELRTGVVARRDKDGLVLEPGGERVAAQRVYAVPRLVGPAIDGLPADEEAFIRAGDDARVQGCERTWAAGDAVISPIKFGGLATHQARRAASAIARLAGVDDAPDPGEPVLHGRLLVGRRMRRLSGRGDADLARKHPAALRMKQRVERVAAHQPDQPHSRRRSVPAAVTVRLRPHDP